MRNRHAEKVTSNLIRLLKEKRLEKGLSHQALADAAGVDRSTISRVESGKRMPTILVCLKIANALNESLSELITESQH
jgi:putative transcriptional regulator